MDLLSFLKAIPPLERPAFAVRCETTIGHMTNTAYGYRPCGERLAIAIERESGGKVTCEELRPDVDWAYLRGTAARRGAKRATAVG